MATACRALAVGAIISGAIAAPLSAADPVNYSSPTWQVGQWAQYSVVEDNVIPCVNSYQPDGISDYRKIESSTIKVSIVGTDTVNGRTYYWYEFKQTKPGYWYFPTTDLGKAGSPPPLYASGTRTVIVKMLVDGPEFADIRRYQVKIDSEPAREFTDGYLAALPGEMRELLGKRQLRSDLVLMEGSGAAYVDAVSGNNWAAQSFTALSTRINGVSVDLKRTQGQNYDLVVELYDDNGGLPGTSLAREVVPYSEVPTTGGLVDAVFTWPVPTRPGTRYHVVLHTTTTEPGATTVYQIKRTGTASTYSIGSAESAYRGTGWTPVAYGFDYKIAILRELDQAISEDIICDAVCSAMDNAIGGSKWAGQSFRIRRATNIHGVALDVKRLQSHDLVVEIRKDAGGMPGTLLRSKVIPYQAVPTYGKFIRADFDEPVRVVPGQVCHLVAHTLGNQGSVGGSYQWRLTDPYVSKYPDGEQRSSSDAGQTWTSYTGRDLAFVIMESDPTEAGWSLIKPMCHPSDVAHIDRWGGYNAAIGGTSWAAQQIRPNESNITGITLDLKRLEDFDLKVELYSDNNGLPGASLASQTVPYNRINQQGGYVTVFFDSPVAVTAGESYHVVVHTLSDQGTDGASYGWRFGSGGYSTYPYGEAETGTSGVFTGNDASGRDYYVVTHFLTPQAQETISTAGGSFNADRIITNRGAVESWLSNLVPVTGIAKRASGEGVGMQYADDSLDTRQDDLSSLYWHSIIGGIRQCAQQVYAGTAQISGVSLYLKRIQDYDLVVELMGDRAGLPSNTVIAGTTIPYSSVSTTGGWIDAYFDRPITVTARGNYHIVIHTAGSQGTYAGSYQVGLTNESTSTYSLGQEETASGTSWNNDSSGRDLLFKLHYARSNRFHNSYQTLTLSSYGQTGATSEITNPVRLSLKSAVPNSDGNVVNSPTILGGFRYEPGYADSDVIKQEWFNAGGNYSPSVYRYDRGQSERAFSDSKPYYYGIARNWHSDLFDKWRPGMKGVSWQDEPYAIQVDGSKVSSYLRDASSEAEAAARFKEYVKWYLTNKFRYWAGEVVPSYDVEYPLSFNLAAGADVAMVEEWLNGPPSFFLDGVSFNQTSDMVKINNAALRGYARAYGKMWGKGAYHGPLMNGWATLVLNSAFDEGADYLLYWADQTGDYPAALTSIAQVRAHINATRQSEYLPDTVILLPRNFGYNGYGDGVYSWGIGKDGSAAMPWEEYHWKDVMQDFYAKVKEMLVAGTPFDIAYDGAFKSYLYKNIYRFNGTEGNWWNGEWHWRVPVSLGYNASDLPAGTIVQVPVDFEDKLKQMGVADPDLDEKSIRVVSYDRATNAFTLISSGNTQYNDLYYNNVFDGANNGRGDVRFRLETSLAANTSRIYYIYFDTTDNGTKPAWGTTLGGGTATKYNNVRLPTFVDPNQYESGFKGADSPGGGSPTPSSSQVTGQVRIQGVTGDKWLMPIGIELIQGGAVLRHEVIFLDASGNYTLSDVAPGTYDVAFTAAKSPRKIVTGVVVPASGAATCDVSLDSGDLNGDGVIDDADMDILRRNWGKDGD